MIDKPTPKYHEPPIVEAIFDVTFATLGDLKTVHYGSFWNCIKPEYSEVQDLAPLRPLIEPNLGNETPIQLSLSDKPVLPRVWFVNEAQDYVLQIQNSRLIFNWRKKPGNPYPGFKENYQRFCHLLNRFSDFLAQEGLPTLKIRQLELRYVNDIYDINGKDTIADYASMFVDWQPEKNARFLEEPESFNWETQYLLPESLGRLRTLVQGVNFTEEALPGVRLDMIVRGMPASTDKKALDDWFDLAHEYIVLGFADITCPSVQTEVWKKYE